MTSKAEVTAIVEEMKRRAQASPWVPVSVPPRQHYHLFPNGLSLCFSLDVLPETQYWHLSIARIPGGPTKEEVELWRQAFFNEEPIIQLPSQTPYLVGKHFYWKASSEGKE